MNNIHDNDVNNIAEWNLLHDIINPSKHVKPPNYHYSPILDRCMYTRRARWNITVGLAVTGIQLL